MTFVDREIPLRARGRRIVAYTLVSEVDRSATAGRGDTLERAIRHGWHLCTRARIV